MLLPANGSSDLVPEIVASLMKVPVNVLLHGCIFVGIEMSFLWYRGGPSLLFGIEILFWHRDSAFCCSASRSSSSWDQPVHVLGPRLLVDYRSRNLDTEKKIENLDTNKEDISIPTERATHSKYPMNLVLEVGGLGVLSTVDWVYRQDIITEAGAEIKNRLA